MPTLTVENYLKAALQLTLHGSTDWVTTGQLASSLAVAPGTVTSMMKTLAETGLAHYRPYEGVRLTMEGRALAMRILRRHRLIELFLVKTLNLSWDQVHEEAEHMEHAVSDRLIDTIDAFLGHPASDPHGDPIPSADGTMRVSLEGIVPLNGVAAGRRIRLIRVVHQDGDFLRYLTESGVTLDQIGSVTSNNAAVGVVTIDFGGRSISLSQLAARQLLVEDLGSTDKVAEKTDFADQTKENVDRGLTK